MISESTVFAHQEGIQTRKYLKSIIIEPGITLNETAAFVFERMDGHRTLGDICNEMVSTYDVDYNTALNDVVSVSAYLIEKNAILTVVE
ncbi:PqqD family protein [Alicyclobacillus suci]|uniref:PqqD family protein n=1 Tax=Alicyclobacillus suci TaxID=2816080 RepID=UPI001A903A52|nr:PqqD family protein [Alicyclobacillus suci]